jgi:hypothetical protein
MVLAFTHMLPSKTSSKKYIKRQGIAQKQGFFCVRLSHGQTFHDDLKHMILTTTKEQCGQTIAY